MLIQFCWKKINKQEINQIPPYEYIEMPYMWVKSSPKSISKLEIMWEINKWEKGYVASCVVSKERDQGKHWTMLINN